MSTQPITATRWSRKIEAQIVEQVSRCIAQGDSERAAALDAEVARGTLRYWLKRTENIDAPAEYRAFFESPAGQEFLHRLVVALHLVVELVVGGGIRPVITILELLHLCGFLACSVGTHHAIARQLEQQVVAFGRSERQRLAEFMSPKTITVCQDETFHPAPCLVAIEPVSNFILAETYAEQRDTETWNQTMSKATEALDVTIIQSTSDESKAILGHARKLGAHHSPDLFHVQHEVSCATSLALTHQVESAEQTVTKVAQQLQTAQKHAQSDSTTAQLAHRAPNDNPLELPSNTALEQAQAQLEQAYDRKQRAADAIRGLGRDYHPFDLSTGLPCTADQIATKLQRHIDTLKDVAAEAKLSERSTTKLAKAQRVLPAMKNTIQFYHEQVNHNLTGLELTEAETDILTDSLLPAAYLERVANRAPTAQRREELRTTAHGLRQQAHTALAHLGICDQQNPILNATAATCADLFQRASSCVEGRNGQLSLRHHHLHRISAQRLESLTVIHNYFLQRPDGTTAAERFFANKPRDLFDYLLNSTRPPPRPAAKRSSAPASAMFN